MGAVRVGVLVSGSGTLLQAILDEQDEHYAVVVVVSDRPDIAALERAARARVPTAIMRLADYPDRPAFSTAVARVLRAHDVDLACNAGYMKILSGTYFDMLGVPAMNSHPALLPAFPGAHGVREALAAGVKVTGATIHFATEDLDGGPIIAQEAIRVLDDDSEESLHERIKVAERRMYPEVIRLFAQERLNVDGRGVRTVSPHPH